MGLDRVAAGESDVLRFDLLGELVLTGIVERIDVGPENELTIAGHLREDPSYGRFVLSREGSAVAGVVWSPRWGQYEVQFVGNDVHKIVELNPSAGANRARRGLNHTPRTGYTEFLVTWAVNQTAAGSA